MYHTHVYNRASCRHIPRLYILYVSHTYVAGRVVDYMRELCTIYNAQAHTIDSLLGPSPRPLEGLRNANSHLPTDFL